MHIYHTGQIESNTLVQQVFKNLLTQSTLKSSTVDNTYLQQLATFSPHCKEAAPSINFLKDRYSKERDFTGMSLD